MEQELNLTFENFFDAVRSYIDDERELSVVKKAYEFARITHTGEKRRTGEDYITHPLNVAYILTKIHSDYETLCAGLLHDVIKMDNVEEEVLVNEFGTNIAKLVKEVTKINKLLQKNIGWSM